MNERHLAPHPPSEALTPKLGGGGDFHGPLPASLESSLFQANRPQLLPLPDLPAALQSVLVPGQDDLWGIQAEGGSQLPGPRLRLLGTGN